MIDARLDLLHRDSHLLVINKPAGLVCHPTKNGPLSSLVGRVRLLLGESVDQHLINRLDRETSGVTLVALDDETAREWRKAWERREVRKTYMAVVHGWPEMDKGSIDLPLGKDEASCVAIKDCVRADGAASKTRWSVTRRFTRLGNNYSLLEVLPLSGRKHQIRIHLSHMGHPIVGDKIYGGDEQIYLSFVEGRMTEEQRKRMVLENHALHAWRLEASILGEPKLFEAPPPAVFQEFLRSET